MRTLRTSGYGKSCGWTVDDHSRQRLDHMKRLCTIALGINVGDSVLIRRGLQLLSSEYDALTEELRDTAGEDRRRLINAEALALQSAAKSFTCVPLPSISPGSIGPTFAERSAAAGRSTREKLIQMFSVREET